MEEHFHEGCFWFFACDVLMFISCCLRKFRYSQNKFPAFHFLQWSVAFYNNLCGWATYLVKFPPSELSPRKEINDDSTEGL